MQKITGYELKEQIHHSERTIVHRARRESDGLPVVIKILADEFPSAEKIARFKREYELGQRVSGRGAVVVFAVEQLRGSLAIVMDDFGGRSLGGLLAERRLPLAEALALGARIAAALSEIHAARIVHKDVNPSNILVSPDAEGVRFIDFGLSTALPRESPSLRALNVLEGTLPYISPEQTGRMNRAVDLRSDLYSLGVTLYEMLTGEQPLVASDPVELVHLHLAQRPIPPHEVDPAIPRPVSDVVMKLLAKNAEDRYQSAAGVVYDLEACRAGGAALAGFVPGAHDSSDRFQLPQRLYGREAEVAVLMSTFERAARGRAELMLVTGYSGVGKSSLVNEIHKPVVARRGYFAAGKFDQLNRDVPYASLIQAFGDLTRQILTESEQRLDRFRRRILAALGESGQVVVDVIPNVERIVGPQPPVPPLLPSEAQNRFNLVFQRFVHALAAEEHPIVLFLDDLQWADLASLKLIESLLADPGLGHLLLVGAYRDNEVGGGHPLRMTIEALDKAGAERTTLTLAPLVPADVEAFVAETLHGDAGRAAPLAALMVDRTGGNPFFLGQLLRSLHDDGLLSYDPALRGFGFDLDAIRAHALTDDVAELMAHKIQRLPERTQEVLELAASIGNRFDLATMALVSGRTPAETAGDLYRALEQGLVVPLDERFRLAEQGGADDARYAFAHDRVQQAAYSLIAPDARPGIHLRIGQLLLASTPPALLEERLFDVVNQLDLGTDRGAPEEARLELARLNLAAGRKARASAAFEPARRYLEAGIRLLPDHGFEQHHQLAVDLHVDAMYAAYLTGDFARAEELAKIALERATMLEKVGIHEIQMLFYAARLEFPEAIRTGTQALDLLGAPLSLDVDLGGALAAVGRTHALLGPDPARTLADLPEMTDPVRLSTLRVLVSLSAPVYSAKAIAFMPLVCEMVEVCLRHGNSVLSAFAYADYAVVRCALGDVEGGNQLGTLALEMLDRFDTRAIKAKVIMIVCGYVRPWKTHVRGSLDLLREAVRVGLEVGDIDFAGHSTVCHGAAMLHTGEPLDAVARSLAGDAAKMASLRLEMARISVQALRQTVVNLTGGSPDPGRLAGAEIDAYATLPMLIETHVDNVIGIVDICRCMLAYLFGDPAEAVAAAEHAAPFMLSQTGFILVAVYNFYQSLALCAAARGEDDAARAPLLAKIAENQAQMKGWSDNAPANYLHRYRLVEAERARLAGDHLGAAGLYQQAAEGAAEHRFVQDEALAHELAGELYLSLGRERLARDSFLDAANAYRRWGAEAKVTDLERRFPSAFSRAAASLSTTRSSSTSGVALDLVTVLKAAQAISAEIVLDRLLDQLMRIVIENAGAQRGALLLVDPDGRLSIAAQRAVGEGGEGEGGPGAAFDGGALTASALVQYVARTRESVVLNDAAAEGMFSADPYVVGHRPRSVLCGPLVNQGKLVAIVHLENNLAPGAFTADRLEVLRLLSGQAALSIQNALLYARLEEHSRTLEHRVQERTHELRAKNEELAGTLEQLRATQRQLVSQEKLASLGALTAGIAHEIKNPLNFVKNFAQLSVDLAAELQGSLDGQRERLAPDVADEVAETVAALHDNARKIAEHGQRANQIIDGMLMHSREAPGAREPTDLNKVVADSITLVHHGYRGKAGDFALTVDARYDPAVGLVDVAAAEISRVFVNLVQNACYAMLQKQKRGGAFRAVLSVSTRDRGDRVEVRIRDNGVGIAPAIRPRLFTPFFTTKPSGEGTGLGLSISHDILVGHQGKMSLDSVEGEFTEFVVDLPRRARAVG